MKKRILSIILSTVMICCIFVGLSPKVSAADTDYPWMYLTNRDDDFYVGDNISLKFEVFREYNNEIYYVEVYDSNNKLLASCEKKMYSGTSSIVDYTVTWDTSGYAPGIYKVVTSSEFYSLYRWNTSPNEDTYYFTLKDPSERPVIGWNSNSIGWWYLKSDNTYCVNEWLYLDGCWYYFDQGGYMATGWKYIGNEYYYFTSSGNMVTGWLQLDSVWYYLNGSGKMVTGWNLIGNNWYYMNNGGAMATGWKYIDNNYYYFTSGGNMVTGWLQLNSVWYYLNGSGKMVTGWNLIGDNWYYMNEGGAMMTGWVFSNGNWYYLNDGGAMMTGWIYVDNTYYWLDASGAWRA